MQGSDKGKAETWTRQLKEYFQELSLSNPPPDATPASSLNPVPQGGIGGEMHLPNRVGGGGLMAIQELQAGSSEKEESKTSNTAMPEFPLYFSERDFRGDVRIGRQYGTLVTSFQT